MIQKIKEKLDYIMWYEMPLWAVAIVVVAAIIIF